MKTDKKNQSKSLNFHILPLGQRASKKLVERGKIHEMFFCEITEVTKQQNFKVNEKHRKKKSLYMSCGIPTEHKDFEEVFNNIHWYKKPDPKMIAHPLNQKVYIQLIGKAALHMDWRFILKMRLVCKKWKGWVELYFQKIIVSSNFSAIGCTQIGLGKKQEVSRIKFATAQYMSQKSLIEEGLNNIIFDKYSIETRQISAFDPFRRTWIVSDFKSWKKLLLITIPFKVFSKIDLKSLDQEKIKDWTLRVIELTKDLLEEPIVFECRVKNVEHLYLDAIKKFDLKKIGVIEHQTVDEAWSSVSEKISHIKLTEYNSETSLAPNVEELIIDYITADVVDLSAYKNLKRIGISSFHASIKFKVNANLEEFWAPDCCFYVGSQLSGIKYANKLRILNLSVITEPITLNSSELSFVRLESIDNSLNILNCQPWLRIEIRRVSSHIISNQIGFNAQIKLPKQYKDSIIIDCEKKERTKIKKIIKWV